MYVGISHIDFDTSHQETRVDHIYGDFRGVLLLVFLEKTFFMLFSPKNVFDQFYYNCSSKILDPQASVWFLIVPILKEIDSKSGKWVSFISSTFPKPLERPFLKDL